MTDTQKPQACASCKKAEEANGKTLLRRASCHEVSYCNQDCQKADWKSHKKNCNFQPKSKLSGSSSGITPKRLYGITTKHALEQQPKEQGFKMLVDSYRMRVEDELNFRGDVHEDSAIGSGDPAAGFRRYLMKAATRKDVLPSWWNDEKREACVAFGCRTWVAAKMVLFLLERQAFCAGSNVVREQIRDTADAEYNSGDGNP